VYSDTVQQFVALLETDELDCWFHEDGANCHTTNETLNMFREFLGNHLLPQIIRPPRSRDLPRRFFFLWDHLKERTYKGNPRTLNDLNKKAISQALKDITPTMLRRLSGSVRNRIQLCLQENGGHFQ
jgi:hypothetical protein